MEEEKEDFEKGKKFLERIALRLRRDLGREELCSQLVHHSPATPLPTALPPMAPSLQATPESWRRWMRTATRSGMVRRRTAALKRQFETSETSDCNHIM